MKKLTLLLLLIFLIGCQSGYQQFYVENLNHKTLTEVELLKVGEKPKLINSSNIDRDTLALRSQNYIVVGYSSFNGSYEDPENALDQAKRIGATIVLVSSEYTNTETTHSSIAVPDNRTTYHSGSVQGDLSMNYNGQSKSYGTQYVPVTSNTRRFDQTAVFLMKSTKKFRYGFEYMDLTVDLRQKYERNTGVLISLVLEKSPAFYANLLAGDIIISLNDKDVRNTSDLQNFLKAVPLNQKNVKVEVIRKGLKKTFKIKLDS